MKNHEGFSVLHALLILVIIAGVGFIGWYVFNAKQNTDNASSMDKNSDQITKPLTATQETTYSCDEGTKTQYLQVTVNGGFKIPLNAAICDAYFVPNKTADREDQGAIGFKSLDTIPGCKAEVMSGVGGAGGSLTSGAIHIYYSGPFASFADYPNSFKVGNEYYELTAGCESNNTQQQQIIMNLQQAIIKASKNSIAL